MSKRSKNTLLLTTLVLVFLFTVNFAFAATLENPLGEGNNDPRRIIGNVISALLGIVGSITLAVFIYGGFLWVTSAGNDEKIAKGKNIIIWASFGLAVIFASYAMVSFVVGALTGTPPSVTSGLPPSL